MQIIASLFTTRSDLSAEPCEISEGLWLRTLG